MDHKGFYLLFSCNWPSLIKGSHFSFVTDSACLFIWISLSSNLKGKFSLIVMSTQIEMISPYSKGKQIIRQHTVNFLSQLYLPSAHLTFPPITRWNRQTFNYPPNVSHPSYYLSQPANVLVLSVTQLPAFSEVSGIANLTFTLELIACFLVCVDLCMSGERTPWPSCDSLAWMLIHSDGCGINKSFWHNTGAYGGGEMGQML